MRLNDLYSAKAEVINKKPKRLGRGRGCGHGKTSGRGHKGQKARSGKKLRPGFEGGQMPLTRRVPKRGFRNPFKTTYQIVNLENLNRFKKDSAVTIEILKQERVIKDVKVPIKILGSGKINKALTIQANAVSKQAKEKIEQAGGNVKIIS